MKRKDLFVPLFACFGAFFFFAVTAYLPLTSFGSFTILLVQLGGVLILMCCFPVGAIALLACVIDHVRSKAFKTFFFSVALFVGSLIGIRFGGIIRMNAFHNLEKRSVYLVEAINDYIKNEKSVPSDLIDLIPEYLSELPTTGMGAYPAYELVIPADANNHSGNPWVLMVHCSLGFLNWDEFIYYPNQNYSDYGRGGYFEVIGDWAYVHE